MEKIYRFIKANALSFTLIIAISIGSLLGLLMGPKAAKLKPFGDIFLNLMFTIVVPLVFFSVASAVANMKDSKRLGKIFAVMITLFVIAGAIASSLMIFIVKIFPPAKNITLNMPNNFELQKVSASEQVVKALTVSDFGEILSKKHILALIIMAILTGLATSSAKEKGKPVLDFLNSVSTIMMKIVHYIMLYAPIGLGAYFAYLIGVFGPDLLGTYYRAVAIYYPVSVLYFFVGFSFYAFLAGKGGIKTFWKNITPAVATSLATCSSMATIPSNLECAKNSNVPEDIREVVIPVGSSIHMDGSSLACILKIALLFGLFGRDFSGVDTLISAAGVAILSGTVMSGIPGGGFLGELLIVVLYGFPIESLPIVTMIGTLVDPPATMVNAISNNVISMVVARVLDGKKEWC